MARSLKLYTLILIALLYLPLAVTFIYSFNTNKFIGSWTGFTTKWYSVVLKDSLFYKALGNSIGVAISSAILSIIMALPAALSTRRSDRRLAQLLIYPPVIIPEITEAVALMLMLVYLGFPLGFISVVIGHTAFNIAYAYIVLSPIASSSKRLEIAARTLGASPREAFLRVTIPSILPGIIAAVAITFLMSFTDFVKTLFTSGPGFITLPILIWNRARRPGLTPETSQPALAAITSIIVIVNLAFLAIYAKYLMPREGE